MVGSACGYCGAKAVAAGVMIGDLGLAMIYLGDDMGFDGLDESEGGGRGDDFDPVAHPPLVGAGCG